MQKKDWTESWNEYEILMGVALDEVLRVLLLKVLCFEVMDE